MMPMPAMSPTPSPAATTHVSCGGRLVAADGRELPLTGTAIRGAARGGIARVVLEQRFANPYDEPLRVTYQVPLPADAAVSGYAFRIGDRRMVGEIDRRADARQRFEEAILEGQSAALLEEERADLFTQEIGNIPPGEEVVVEISIDQRLAWLDEGAWEWRFPTVVAPRYLGAEGRVPDAERVTVDVADRPLDARTSLALCVHDSTTRAPSSPSHALDVATNGATTDVVFRDEEGARLDRDVVVRWSVAQPEVGATLAVARPGGSDAAYGLFTLVPPEREHQGEPVARDLIVLLDTSGSMHGMPLAQAQRVVAALIDTLSERDRLEMLSFASFVTRWARKPIAMNHRGRERAHKWVASLRASGGTEMRSGILEALAPLRYGAQRQVVLVTDGLIGFESEIVGEILDRLPEGSRVHTVGVGSGVNRSLTRSAARAGRGEEVIIGIDEDAERAARRLVARTDAPLVVDLELSGDALLDSAPAKLPDLFAGAPALLSLHLRAEGGQLAVRGRTERGVWEHRLQVSPAAEATGDAAIAALYARERVDDLETLRAAHGDPAIDNEIERLGLAFSIATRLTSWVAIDEEASVDPREPTRRVRMPHELPYGMSAEGVGLRPAMAPTGVMRSLAFAAPAAPMPAAPMAPQRRRVFGGLTRSRPAAPGAAGGTGGAPPPAGGPPRMGAAPPPPPTGAPPQPHETTQTGVLRTTRILKGVILLHTDEQIVVEFTLDERDLDWSTPSFAELHLEQGVVSAPVDATRSTRSGTVAAGSTLRITLQHAGARPNAVMLQLPGTTLLIGL